MPRYPKQRKSVKSKALTQELYSKKGKLIASIDPPQQMPNLEGTVAEPALMWYFISWSQRLKDWSYKKKMKYAKEISKISDIVPIHLIDFNLQRKEIEKALKEQGITLFDYKDGKFVMRDEDRVTVVSEMSATRLYALFAYLVDSIGGGLQDMQGFSFIKMAKILMAKEHEITVKNLGKDEGKKAE